MQNWNEIPGANGYGGGEIASERKRRGPARLGSRWIWSCWDIMLPPDDSGNVGRSGAK